MGRVLPHRPLGFAIDGINARSVRSIQQIGIIEAPSP